MPTIPKIPALDRLAPQLRTFQGLIASFAQLQFELDSPRLEWIPETEEERRRLPLFSYSSTKERFETLVHFDTIGRALLHSNRMLEHEVPLNFYRRARIELNAKNYVFAFMNAFLMLEHLYGGGKFRSHQMKERFASSPALVDAIAAARTRFLRLSGERSEFRTFLETAQVEKIIARIVKDRGHLFHSTRTGPARWSPERQHEFRSESLFLLNVGLEVVHQLGVDLFSEQTTGDYITQAEAAGMKATLKGTCTYIDRFDGSKRTEPYEINVQGIWSNAAYFPQVIVDTLTRFQDSHPGDVLVSLTVTGPDGAVLAQLHVHAR